MPRMSVPSTLGRKARAVALLTLGALALHQARYLLAYGDAYGAAPDHRHSYLEQLAPLLVAAVVATIIVSILAPAVRRRSPAAPGSGCATERAAAYALALLGVYFVQELSEGVASGAHAAGIESVLGAAGWLVLPLAMGLGAVAALLGSFLDRVEVRVAGCAPSVRRRAPRRLAGPVLVWVRSLASLLLAFGISRRPPPLLAAG